MSQPTWNTASGSIGTLDEGTPISFTFVATPSVSTYTLQYTLLNGIFPEATAPFSLNQSTGVLTGTAAQVAQPSDYSFTIRVKEYDGAVYKNFSDRSFSMTIIGKTSPSFVTPSGALYTPYILDSTWDPFQIVISNPDPGTNAIVSLISGSLPPGLEINENGLIQGYATPPLNSFLVPITSDPYVFTLQITSESGIAQRQFSITVQNQQLEPGYTGRKPVLMNTQPPSFNISITDPNQPYYTESNIGIFSQDNYFIFKLLGNNFSSGPLSYNLTSGSLPSGISDNILYSNTNVEITIDTSNAGTGYVIGDQLRILGTDVGGESPANDIIFEVATIGSLGSLMTVDNISGTNVDSFESYSGVSIQSDSPGVGIGAMCGINKINASWISGTLAVTPTAIEAYTFTYSAFNNTNLLASDPVTFTMTVVEQIDNIPIDISVSWLTDSYLGVINNGQVSTFTVEAVSASGFNLEYSLTSGSLPPNLTLLDTGEITGRLAFEAAGTIIPENTETDYTFTISATNPLYPEITSSKIFTFTAIQKYSVPYENLYIKALLSESDRALIDSLLTNTSIIPSSYLYRPSDQYFGKATDIIYTHMYGVNVAPLEDYLNAVNINHYWRNILLGPIRTAVARDSNNEIVYEVVYSEIIDYLVNDQGVSISKEIFWPTTIPLLLNGDTANNVLMDTDMTYYDTNAVLKVVSGSVTASTTIVLNWFTEDLQLGMNLVGPAITNDGDGLPPKVTSINATTNTITVNIPQTLATSDYIIFYNAAYTSMTPGYATTLYPNSLDNMRQQIADTIGFLNDASILPLWMQSQQVNGNVLGYTPSWVICYTKPGYSETIKNNILENWNHSLNEINFKIDRFEIDKSLTWDYDPDTETWAGLPSGIPYPSPSNSQDQYIYFPRRTILPDQTQQG
jgi:hypothetical protein